MINISSATPILALIGVLSCQFQLLSLPFLLQLWQSALPPPLKLVHEQLLCNLVECFTHI